MMKKVLVSIITVLTAIVLMGCPPVVVPEAIPNTTINLIAITGVTAPVKGAIPVTKITETAQYTGTVKWSPEVNTTFAPSTQYSAIITLTPKTGFTLKGVVANSFKVAGATTTNSIGSGILTAEFPLTDLNVVNIKTISPVIVPIIGQVAATTIKETDQYTGTVIWNPLVGDTFLPNTTYTATITLSPNPGYTFSGVAENSFEVLWATATNTADSGIVTAVFPTTAKTVNIVTIPSVPAPSIGAIPVTTITETDQYTGTVSWDPYVFVTFAPNTTYTATVKLTPNSGFTFIGVVKNSFQMPGATTTNNADSGIVKAVFPTTDKTVNIMTIPSIPAPSIGATPVTTLAETSQYTGTLSWSPAVNGTFATGTTYTATITLTPKAGYTLTGVAANFFKIARATTTNSASSGVVTAVFSNTEKTVDIMTIPSVPTPSTGAVAGTTITETDQYTGTISWDPFVTGTFVAGTQYTAIISLMPKAGFTLSGVAANSFRVAGATTTNSAGSGIVTAVFPATLLTRISITTISGLTVPSAGAIPVTKITDTVQYTGTVSWSPIVSGTFAPSTTYSASLTLTPKFGYTLDGVAANSFSVAGATTTNSVDSGIVTVVFPVTETTINITDISGVTAPIIAWYPVTKITETAQYTGTVSWSPAVSGIFASHTKYSASITLKPKPGYTLTGVASNSFSVAGATTTNSVDSGLVSAIFPVTDMTINITNIIGVTAPITGASPVTTIPETAQYTGTVSWKPKVPKTFWTGTTYTATITLTPKAGYTLSFLKENSFTVDGANNAKYNSIYGSVSVIFPATLPNLEPLTDCTSTCIGTLKAIQGGTFNNGTANMTISSFRMSQYEITREQFKTIMAIDPSEFYWAGSIPLFSGGLSDPVQYVTWAQAIAFCNKLSLKEGLTPVYKVMGIEDWDNLIYSDIQCNASFYRPEIDWNANGYRLPTEAEWQFAARGGNSSHNYTYSGSNTIGEVAVFGWCSDETGETKTERTNPVGSKAKNELGLYDMSGNVWELCSDSFASYPITDQIDYRGPTSYIDERVIRGGCYDDNSSACTVDFRKNQHCTLETRITGFRVVRN